MKNKLLNMKSLIQILLCLSVAFAFYPACKPQQNRPNAVIEKGKVITEIKCAADTTVSYALFLPYNYDNASAWPVIIAFDPHAAGHLPVELFAAEAGKCGFVVAGSNNSKNGMDFNQVTEIYKKMLSDLVSRFNIDTGCIYTLGFSGGGRIAGSLAMTERGISGVVSCGAGLQATGQPPVQPFSFLGVAGNGDFNWTELAIIDPQLEQAGFVHHFLDFSGKHEWPPSEILTQIMDWIQFDAMRKGKIPINRNAINRFIDQNDSIANLPYVAENPYEQWKVYVKMKHYLQGLTDVSALEGMLVRLEKDPVLKQKQQEIQEQIKLEQNRREHYASMLPAPDPEFWKTESIKLRTLSQNMQENNNAQVYSRLLGFLSLSSYMYCNNALKQNNLESAGKYVEIYGQVDPGNPEHQYLAAIIAARKQNKHAVIKALTSALELGFKDKARLMADPEFADYHGKSEFEAILRQL